METLIRDVRLGYRLLLRQPGFSLIAILTLALGIGGSTAIFSVVDVALLRPLPYPNPDRLVDVDIEVPLDGRAAYLGPSMEDVRVWQQDGRIFSHVAVWRNEMQPVVLDGPQPERIDVRCISDQYLGLFGVQPFLGRAFSPDDMRAGAAPVVIISYAYWRTRFGGDRKVIDSTIRLDNEPATIVGVLPAGFYEETRIWRPLQPDDFVFKARGSGASVYGRLRPGITIEQAQRRLLAVSPRLDQRGRKLTAVRLESLYESTTAGYRSTANILSAAVGFILLIACINVAGLLLARGAARRAELAIRASIGAGRARLFRQLLTESLVLSLAGGAIGVLLAWLTLDALVANIPMSLPSNSPVTLNPRVLAFAALLSLATGTLFGLLPALRLSSVRVTEALSHASRRHGSALSRRGGQVLIAIEVALALVLLAGAGLMIRSFSHLVAVDVGFDPESFLTMEVVPVNPDDATMKHYYPALVDALRNVPGVEAAGAADSLPLAGGSTHTFAMVEGERMPVVIRTFIPGYFEAIGFRLIEGRFPSPSDRGTAPTPAMLSVQAARQMFPRGSAIGRRFEVGKGSYQVLGVVGEVRHRGPLRPAEAEVYLAFGIGAARPMMVAVRPHGVTRELDTALRRTAQGVGPRVVVDRIRRGSDWFDDRVVTPRRRTVLLGLLGALGLLLSLVGVFGVTAYAVARRTQEIGVRMAFGARPAEVVRAVVWDSLWPVAIGIVAGLGGAALATRVIASFLFDTRPVDLPTFATVAVVLGLAAFVAAWIPARRASRVDPVSALRAE